MFDAATILPGAESELLLVPQANVMPLLGEVMPLLKPAIDRSDNHWADYDVAAALLSGGMHLWISVRGNKVECAMATRITYYPRMPVLSLMFIGGNIRKNWLHFEHNIAQWAKAQGCKQLEGFHRKGWMRVLKGWRFSWTYGTRDL